MPPSLVHGGEEESHCHQVQRVTHDDPQNTHESLVNCVYWGAEIYKNMTHRPSAAAPHMAPESRTEMFVNNIVGALLRALNPYQAEGP